MGAKVANRLSAGERHRRIGDIASGQHGVISRNQLLAAGQTRQTIANQVASGRLRRIHRGVYAVGHTALTLTGRIKAASLACGPGSLVSHASAAQLWGLLDPDDYEDGVHVTVEGSRGRGHDHIRTHKVLEVFASDRFTREGIPVTSAALTLLNVAASMSKSDAEKAYNRALILKRVSIWTIREVLARYPRSPGRATLAKLAGTSDNYLRSPAEKDFLNLVRKAKLVEPRCNAKIEGLEVDFYWPKLRLVVEVDGFTYHQGKVQFEKDHARTETLVTAGYTVLAVTAQRVRDAPDEVSSLLRTFLPPAQPSTT